MKIAVLGGTGSMGRWAVRELASEKWVEQVLVVARNFEKAEDFAEQMGPKCGAQRVNIDDHADIVRCLRDWDVALGMVGPFYKYEVKMARAAVEAGTHYISIGDDADVVEGFLAQDQAAKEMGVTAISGVGATPGMANLFARLATGQMDEVDEIAIYWAVSPTDGAGKAGVHHVLHTLTGMTPCFMEGRRTERKAGSGVETIRFPEPMGVQKVFYTGHHAAVTIPRYMAAKTVSVKGGLSDPLLVVLVKLLVRLGLTNSERKRTAITNLAYSMLPLSQRMRKSPNLGSALRVDVTGSRGEEPVRRTYGSWGHMAPWTVIPCCTAVRMLAEGQITAKGAMSAEACIDPLPFLKRCMEKELRLYEGDDLSRLLRL